MLYFIYLIIILSGLFRKCNKDYDLIIIVLICIMVAFGTNGPDYLNYEEVYNYVKTGVYYTSTGKGWFALCFLGNAFNLSFVQFKVLVVAGGLFLIRSTIKRYSHKGSAVWGLYLIYPALLDFVQFRFFLANAIIIYAVKFLLRHDSKGKFLYALFVICASLVHSSMSVYLILFVIPKLGTGFKKYFPYIICFLTIVIYIGRSKLPEIAILFGFNLNRISEYFEGETISLVGALFCFLIYLCNYILIKKLEESLRKVSNKNVLKKDFDYIDFMKNANLAIFLTFPLVLFDADFMRIQRTLWVLNFIAFTIPMNYGANFIKILKVNFKSKYIYLGYTIVANIAFISANSFNVVASFLSFSNWNI